MKIVIEKKSEVAR